MFPIIVLTLFVAAVVAEDTYTTKFDTVDLDSILKNDRLLSNYHKCIMDKGPCTPDGQELKNHLPEALENGCAKCSEKQKKGGEKVLRYLYEKKPELFKELEAKYDPEGKYRIKYKKRIEEAGVKLDH